ncbi:tetratricopeptide repeat protein 30 homolog isoform X1 [Contarinia nasturtii]|uniref:tetratricopeptide repeat protein 30 homolog isoform X1 n=1 Tax=Contarinia nasturtii TaxID=265458 RepID=UPI0012D3D5F6|nr:tetratricopeptide repeat protein 30 homolog isoform X1 [Contarinia nasturtii]
MFHKKNEIRSGEYTKSIYLLINEQRYTDAISVLCKIPESTNCRAGLSLLGYCYYQCQEYIEASNCYEQLCLLVPNEPGYKFAYAQSLFQSGLFEEAFKITTTIETPELREKILQLQCAIRYFNEEYSSTQTILAQRNPYHESTLNDEGCLLFQANVFDEALQRFTAALQNGGFNPLTAYNAAMCHYRRKENAQALNYISEIVERGIRNYPELGIGAQIENEGGARSVGNPPSLAASGLTQSLNLKAAIEYQEGNLDGAREALMDLPPRSEPELDPVTLHNLALTDTSGGIGTSLRRLAFLLEIGPPTCPAETFANILLLSCKQEMYDTAADILAEHAHLTYKYLSTFLYDLLDAIITVQTSREEADQKLEKLSARLTTKLRTLTAKIQEGRASNDDDIVKRTLREYEEELENYLPVAMARAWLYWLDDDFGTAEREFRSSAEFCSESPLWRLHAAHVLFMRGDKYKEAAAFYEPIVRQNYGDILSVSAAVLGNLCVSYIMTSQNEEAEDLMRKVERAEEIKGNANGHCLHLCIVNLVIGTLYCAKGNYEFGLSRIAHALDNATAGSRLCPDTWFYVKRCVLGLLTGLAKQTLVLPSVVIEEVINLLYTCQSAHMPAVFETTSDENLDEPQTIGLEARKLNALLLQAIEYE